jgi:hypothetical protein
VSEPVFIEVRAGVRYWEDATVNGIQDETGTLIPHRRDSAWCPVIRLADGVVMDWPQGTVSDIYYKVCDDGDYWLLDRERVRVKKWKGHYVPNRFLCHGDNGFGDYVILKVRADGSIEQWIPPNIDPDEWNQIKKETKP